LIYFQSNLKSYSNQIKQDFLGLKDKLKRKDNFSWNYDYILKIIWYYYFFCFFFFKRKNWSL